MDRSEIGTLTISRRPGEKVLIGDSIEIEVVQCSRSGRASLRITAPKDVRISRGPSVRRDAA